MKFVLINNIQDDKAMVLILKGFLVFIFLFLISNILVMHSNFGISVDSVNISLFGNEDEYIDPMNKAAFLEFWHTQIFFIMMILLTLNAVFIRVAKKNIKIMVNLLMISALSSLISLGFAFYFSSSFVVVYLLTFFLWHGVAIYMIIYSFWKLNARSI